MMGRPRRLTPEFWVLEVADAWLIIKKADHDVKACAVVCVGGRTREEALARIADIHERRRLVS